MVWGRPQQKGEPEMGRKLYVGNLSFSTTEDELREYFSQAGTPDTVAIITDRMTGRSRGFGFVEMSTDGEASHAIEVLDGKEFQGRPLKINEARARDAHPGGYAGSGAQRR